MSILKVLSGRLDTFTGGERQIAQYILDAPEHAVVLSSSDLADRVGCSQSSVVKFSQKLGFSGYQQFKLALNKAKALEWHLPAGIIHGTIDASDSYLVVLQKLVGSKLLSMRESASANSEEMVEKALDLIVEAGRIQLCGVGASSLVARDLSYKLLKLGLMVRLDDDSHIQLAIAAELKEQDLLIALSYTGASLETVRIAERARHSGAKIISITGMQPNPLAALADVSLYTVADEERVRSSAITARDAQFMVIDMLFILLLRRIPGARERIQRYEAAVSVLKVR